MTNYNIEDNIIKKIEHIFNQNEDKRICVVGTTCSGKTTLVNNFGYALDMDEILFSLLTKEEKDYVCQDVWTEEIGDYFEELAKSKIKIKVGNPLFSTVIFDCDLIIYLDIDNETLKDRTMKRNVDLNNAKTMNDKIKTQILNSDVPYITIKINHK